MAQDQEQSLKIIGTVNAKSEYDGKKGIKYTLDIVVQGLRTMLPIIVSPEIYHSIKEGDLFISKLSYQVNQWGSQFSAV